MLIPPAARREGGRHHSTPPAGGSAAPPLRGGGTVRPRPPPQPGSRGAARGAALQRESGTGWRPEKSCSFAMKPSKVVPWRRLVGVTFGMYTAEEIR